MTYKITIYLDNNTEVSIGGLSAEGVAPLKTLDFNLPSVTLHGQTKTFVLAPAHILMIEIAPEPPKS